MSLPPNPAHLGLAEAADLVRRGELLSADLVTALLTVARDADDRFNLFIAPPTRAALEAASGADVARQRGERLGALHGVPVAVKDMFDVAGLPTTAGSLAAGPPARADSAAVARLRGAGAIPFGKTHTHEWALGTTSVNPHHGTCLNPLDPTRSPGGSSGGSAAGVSARAFPAALGTDTGGSVRIPAAFCGVVGFKPTLGRISLFGTVPLSWTLDHVGTLTRTVADARLLCQVLFGYDARDPASRAFGAPTASDGRPLTVGLVTEAVDRARPAVGAATAAALARLEEGGLAAVSVDALDWAGALEAVGTILLSDAAALHAGLTVAAPYGPDVAARLQAGGNLSGRAVATAHRHRAVWRRRLATVFDRVDVLIAPTTPDTAPLLAGLEGVAAAKAHTSLTAPFNLAGCPAISVPFGTDEHGLPIGVQLAAAPGMDYAVLAAAELLEAA